jgi:ubiquinone/menaquinone biosynthesis C-methylase UbiE
VRIPRAVTYRIRQLLDDWTPPVIRDRRFFTWLPARLVIGRDAYLFLEFKDRALGLTDEEFSAVYRAAHRVVIQRETDLTRGSLAEVLRSLLGETVLEVGCGSAYLANRISKTHRTTAVDIYLDEEASSKYPKVHFVQAPITQLPFSDRSFDTVVSTHVLEHVQNITRAMAELRRVARRRLIVVVPRQRPYRYTFDLHLHFFPYEYTLISALNPVGPHTCRDLGGDWVYVEEIVPPRAARESARPDVNAPGA